MVVCVDCQEKNWMKLFDWNVKRDYYMDCIVVPCQREISNDDGHVRALREQSAEMANRGSSSSAVREYLYALHRELLFNLRAPVD